MRLEPVTLRFLESRPADCARVLETLGADALAGLMAVLPAKPAAVVLAHMTPDARGACLRVLGEGAAPIVEHLPIALAAPAIRAMEPAACRLLLHALPKVVSIPLGLALRFPEGTVGALLDPQAATVRRDMTIKDTVHIARRAPERLRRYVYVLGERQQLVGVLDVRECLLAARSASVNSLMRADPVFLRARVSLEEAAADTSWQMFDVIPVVDRSRIFLGVLRRRVLEAAIAHGGVDREPGDGLSAAAIDLAELYWQASAVLLTGGREPGGADVER